MFRSLLLSLAGCLLIWSGPLLKAQQKQYPIADMLADKIIAKYRTSSCEQLKAKKEQKEEGKDQNEGQQEKVVELLKKDPAMREHFLNRIAGPIVNKMFECGMVP